MELIRNGNDKSQEASSFSFKKPTDKSIYREMLDFNKARMGETALLFLGSKVSFSKLFKQTDLVADLLVSHGVKKGDTILTCVNGTPQTVSLLLACSKIGVTAMILTPRTGDIGYIMENGEIVICCRSRELYTNEKGESIFSFLIERVLVKDENVRCCKVLGMDYQGHSALAVHLCLNHQEDPTALIKRLEAKLKEDKDVNILPDLYKIRDYFPISEAGKIDMVKMKSETDGFIKA